MTHHQHGNPEWIKDRIGHVTASRVADAVRRLKDGSWAASRNNYMAELVVELMTGVPYSTYTNAAMQWGIEHEAEARAAYEFMQDVTVELCGFVHHPEIAWSGASPDGLVHDDGLVEFKCPNSATHIATLLGERWDRDYIIQVTWQMACTGRRWCDLCSFDPRMPENMRLVIHRIHRDDELISALEKNVVLFLEETDRKVAALRSRYDIARAA